jgi:peptide deformylase
MALLEIMLAGAPVLRENAEKVTRFDKKLGKLLDNMAETMYAAEGCGLAAPQIGLSKRIVVIDAGKGIQEFINPVFKFKEGSCTNVEGCLSVPDYEGEVERAEFVGVEYKDRKGNTKYVEADGLLAIALQHETDHLDGILFIDKASVIMPKEKEEQR